MPRDLYFSRLFGGESFQQTRVELLLCAKTWSQFCEDLKDGEIPTFKSFLKEEEISSFKNMLGNNNIRVTPY